jgi:hypothetical protein
MAGCSLLSTESKRHVTRITREDEMDLRGFSPRGFKLTDWMARYPYVHHQGGTSLKMQAHQLRRLVDPTTCHQRPGEYQQRAEQEQAGQAHEAHPAMVTVRVSRCGAVSYTGT